ncbi:MAG: SGNH hydrolase domain-containing protein [Acidimicrobiales bacterium]
MCGSLQIPGLDPKYEPCVYGSPKATSRIVLLGDSHAWQWSTSVASIAQRRGASFGLLYHAACVVTLTSASLPPNGPPGGSQPSGQVCKEWTEAALKWIHGFDPQTVIVAAYSGDSLTAARLRQGHRGALPPNRDPRSATHPGGTGSRQLHRRSRLPGAHESNIS